MVRSPGRLKKPFPSDSANIFSQIFLSWTWPIFCVGYRKELDYDDLYTCSKYDDADLVGEKLEREWRKELKKSSPCLWKAIFRAFHRSYLKYVMTIGVLEELGVRIAQPFMLGGILDFFKGGGSDISTFYYLIAGFLVCSGTFVVAHHPFFISNARHGMRARVATQRLVLNKLLVVSKAELYNRDVGQIINLISNDVQKFDACAFFLPYLLLVPIQTIIISILLWNDLGLAYLAGFMVIVLFVPLQGLIGRQFSSTRRGIAKFTDQRIRLMSEIINGIQVIKMYSWEKAFADKIATIRRKEIGKIRIGCFLRALNLALSFVVTRTILFACFITYIFLGNTLSAKTVFVSMAFFNSLKITLTFLFPTAIANLSEACVSCHRLTEFLLLKEISNRSPHHVQSSKKSNDEKSIVVENLEAMWDSNSNESCLKNISFSVKSGELLTVVGPVGSGKTSLFQCLLNEIVIKSGKITINGKISYASQDDWIFNASVKDNIIFGEPFEEQKYRKVIKATALDRDIEIFPHKDLTLVGERGVGLSGGQRARVSLARAIYHEADIYLLDDPLAAVDSQVAEHIFTRCCKEYLKSKVVILVTHHFHFLRRSDKILLLDQGQGKPFNSYADLQNSGSDMMTILELDKQQSENRLPRVRTNSSSLVHRLSSSDSFEVDTEMEVPSVAEEVRKSGSVKAKVYWIYIRSGASILLFTITLFFNVLSQVLFSVNDMYLAWWTNFISRTESNSTDYSRNSSDIHANSSLEEIEVIFTNEEPNPNDWFYTMVYTGLVVSLFISAMVRAILFFYMCNRASIRLHDSIFYRLLRSPLSLFEKNPVGRILNRFSTDLGVIDELLPATAFDQMMNSFIIIGILVVVSIVAWYMIIPAVLLIFIVFFLRSIYIKTGRDVKRIESLARSPIYSHISTIVDGLTTIRSSKKEEMFCREFSSYLNDHSAMYYLYCATSRALGVWTDWTGYMYIITTTLVIVIFKDTVPPGSAGLALTQILMLTGMFQWFVRQSAELESQMTSVERIAEYTELSTEAELVTDRRPPPDWPKHGDIRFEKVFLQYASSPKPSLSDIDLEIKSGEKIGIVGRSGAGKSSLVSCLFRLVEVEGRIIIDGIDIGRIGLQDLREKISIIPQEPVIFAGTVRSNLDPFNKSTDLDLWEVLDDVQLKEKVQDSPGNLDHEIREGGDNFSVGQRQLICLARALLRKNKILVIDEATANVDLVTDDLIQRTIRTKFAHCTVLTIAHRLNTIIDSDRVLVLDAGKVKEFAPPHILLQQKNSIFSHLVAKTGSSMSKKLHALAGEYYENSKNKNNH